jgi:hypothetical protein
MYIDALREKILIAPGLMFSNSNRFDHFARLNRGAPYSGKMDQAVRRLGRIIEICWPDTDKKQPSGCLLSHEPILIHSSLAITF